MSSDAWTRVNGPGTGKVEYDDDTIAYDDALTAYDGGDGNDWVPISKPLT